MAVTADAALGAPPRDAGRWLVGALIVALVAATAFNDVVPLLPLGEYESEGFVYVFPLVFGIALLRRPADLAIPTALIAFSIALLVTVIAGVILNYADILAAQFKGRSGMSRVVTQGMAVAIGLLISLLFYNLTLQGFRREISLGARVGLLTMAVVGFFEFASWFSLPGLTQMHEAIAAVIHQNPNYPQRLRATAFEVSWAAVALTFLYPFALADASLRWRSVILISGAVAAMVLLAQSRTALLVIGFQGMILVLGLLWRRFDLLLHAAAVACLGALLVLVTPSVRDTTLRSLSNVIEYGSVSGNLSGSSENVSNVTRLAAIQAAVGMFEEKPLLGVGLGQYGFNYPLHLRSEDLRSFEVRDYTDGSHPNWPPAYSTHARLLAEVGLAGYLLWLGLILGLLVRSARHSDAVTSDGRMHLAVAATLVGWLLLGSSIDSFRFFGGWIAIGVAFALPTGRARDRSGNTSLTISHLHQMR